MLRSSLEYDQELRSELINYHLHFATLVIHDGITEKLPVDFVVDTFVNVLTQFICFALGNCVILRNLNIINLPNYFIQLTKCRQKSCFRC